ncbi:hypothetical protein [Photobacterium kishitanii]|uniref:hypothetical protein n=1 Tax=Photobacterium kishitanii TaxID=318456 RepID=UPI0011B28BE3|nr:hypothetical protein [Photobacterium kishitanii]
MKDLNSGKSIGYITAQQSQYGVVFTPHLSTGLHGFHLHENPSWEEIILTTWWQWGLFSVRSD